MRISTSIKSISFAGLGMMIEWYDFVLYTTLSAYLVTIFFPEFKKSTAALLIMAVFVMSYVGRVIGGSILASFSDRYGRKNVFVLSSILMTGSTFLMATFPVHYIKGIWSVISLFVLRFIQGISAGAETGGGVVFAFEHAASKYKALSIGVIFIFIDLGYMLADIVCTELTAYFSKEEIVHYAWRIPYFIAVFLGIFLFFLRKKSHETPDFEAIEASKLKSRKPFRSIIKGNTPLILLSIGIYAFPACLDNFQDMRVIYITKYFHYKLHEIYLLSITADLFSIVFTATLILLPTRYNVKYLLYFLWFLYIAFILPSFWLLAFKTNLGYLAWTCLSDGAGTITWLFLLLYLNATTPVDVRVSTITLFDNVAQLIGAIFPFFMSYLLNRTGDRFIIPKAGWILSMVMLFSIIGLARYMRKNPINSKKIWLSSDSVEMHQA